MASHKHGMVQSICVVHEMTQVPLGSPDQLASTEASACENLAQWLHPELALFTAFTKGICYKPCSGPGHLAASTEVSAWRV